MTSLFRKIVSRALILLPVIVAGQIGDIYQDTANRIMAAAQSDSASYDRLAELTDTFGPRLSGSQPLEDAIDWILAEMERDGLENVHGEPVMVPHWVRGKESLQLIKPHQRELTILGLGRTIGTRKRGITAEVLVVKTFAELVERSDEVKGKIVLYNAPFLSYGETVAYRAHGANRAAEFGALAVLVRSVTPNSLYTPHTGAQANYADSVKAIPAAAITVEDAMFMQRVQDRGQKIVINLKLGATTLPDANSRNVVAEIVGYEHPEEVVVLGGHIDSWDVGTGAMDDAGGSVAAWEAVKLIRSLGLKPRRTIRVVLWTNEENGLAGGKAYKAAHEGTLDRHILAMESDGGLFKPEGFGFVGSPEAREIMSAVVALLEPIGAGKLEGEHGGADISPLIAAGVPGMGINVERETYFWYHHTRADMVDKLDPHDVNLCVAAMAVVAYVAADMPQKLPRASQN